MYLCTYRKKIPLLLELRSFLLCNPLFFLTPSYLSLNNIWFELSFITYARFSVYKMGYSLNVYASTYKNYGRHHVSSWFLVFVLDKLWKGEKTASFFKYLVFKDFERLKLWIEWIK